MKKTTRAGSLLAVPLLAVGLAACGSTVSTSTFKGERHAVAQRISDYQSDIGAASEKKLCNEDLSSTVRRRLNAASGGCEEALKRQLGSIDDYEATVEQITVSGATATAVVKSTWSGKLRDTTLELVKEGGSWRIAGVTPSVK
jgi:Putative lumazine-binding